MGSPSLGERLSLPALAVFPGPDPTQTLRLRPQTCCWVAMAMLAVQQAVQGVAGYVDGNGGTLRRASIERTPVRGRWRVTPASVHWNPTPTPADLATLLP